MASSEKTESLIHELKEEIHMEKVLFNETRLALSMQFAQEKV